MPGETARRVGVAAVGIPVVLGATWLGGWALAVLLAAAAAVAAAELYGLGRARGAAPFAFIGMAASAGLVLLAQAASGYQAWAGAALGLVLAVLLACMVAAVWLRWPAGEPLTDAALTVAGVLYTGGALSFGVFLRDLPDAAPAFSAVPWHRTAFFLLPLVTTWAGDTSAYFAGRAFGRRKLFPAASPGKTVAGGVAGLLGSVVAAGVLVNFSLARSPALTVGVPLALGLGAALGVAAQLGDVAESVMKRWAGVKDSGRILPGHGGMLDRIDALLLAIPAAYGLVVLAGVTR